jgi:hypothetical protein
MPVVFYDGTAYFFERSEKLTHTYFGGPLEASFTGINHGPLPLHRIITFGGGQEFRQGNITCIYGICYSGCQMAYRETSYNKFDLVDLDPTVSEPDFPYADYPRILPYIPLRVGREMKCTFEEFSTLSCQLLSHLNPSSFIVLVPPSPVLGMSLWGHSGDGECVQMVFECNLSKRTVRAYNQCG